MRRATARAVRPTQSAQRVHFAFSTCAPRHSESDLTHPKCAEGPLSSFNAPNVRRGFTLQNFQKWTAPHPKCAEGTLHSLCICKMCAAPQQERFHPPTERRRFALHVQKVRRATARAIRPTQSAAPATTSARKLESSAPATKSARKALKCCACHESERTALKNCACHKK